jgi:hypothetical protein
MITDLCVPQYRNFAQQSAGNVHSREVLWIRLSASQEPTPPLLMPDHHADTSPRASRNAVNDQGDSQIRAIMS